MVEFDRAEVDAHGKRQVVEADALLSAHELAERVCSTLLPTSRRALLPSLKGRLMH